jgi:hypothetical protein
MKGHMHVRSKMVTIRLYRSWKMRRKRRNKTKKKGVM